MLPAAIFDMDGLMFDTEALWQEGWRMLAKKYGYEPSEDFGRDISGTSGQVMYDTILKYYPNVDEKQFLRKERAFVEDKLAVEVPIKKGLFTILELFRDNGVKMAVASSSQIKMIESNLQKAGVADYFDAVVSSSQVENAKPEPDVFLYAAKQLALSAEDCYVFEDSFGGVRAGAAAGAVTVMIPDQLAPTKEIRALASAVFVDLDEAANAIKNGTL